jgi:hypothetical protein
LEEILTKNICVFASSSNELNEIYYQTAKELGTLIGKCGFNIVYGGSRRGLMYACAGAVKQNGGKVIGIMPEKLANLGFANPDDCDEFIVTPGMRVRKASLDKKSDAVIALAGGYGTLEELSEIIVQKQLGYNTKPIVILNTDNFYNHLLEFFEHIIKQNFASETSKKLYYIANSPIEAIDYIMNYTPSSIESKFVIK